MKNVCAPLVLCFLFMTIGTMAEAQEIIALWDKTIPGSKESTTYQEDRQYNDGQLAGVSRVTTPELYMYKPASPNGTVVVICPGGGYGFLAIHKEGFKVGQWFAERGVTAFVLKYRLPSNTIMEDKTIGPLQDAQRALRLVRDRAREFSLDTSKIGIMGFSAGGHLASSLATHYDQKVYEATTKVSAKPDFAILLYPVVSMENGVTHQGSRENLLGDHPTNSLVEHYSNAKAVTSKSPASFIVHAQDDQAVPVKNSLEYFEALTEKDVPAELHVFEKGGHGFGLGYEAPSNRWPKLLENWLKSQNFL